MRAKLSSGELAVRGDQWPLLVYANQEYDPEVLKHEIYEHALARSYYLSFHRYATVSTCDCLRSI